MKNFNKLPLCSFILLSLLILLVIPQRSNAQCGALSGFKPKASNTSVCSGNTVYVFATGLPVVKWLYRDSTAAPWTVFNSNSDYYSQVLTSAVPAVRTYRAITSTASCASDTTASIDVNIVPIQYSTNSSIKLSASKYNTCSGGTIKVSLMNQSYSPTQWLYRDNGGNWTVFSNVTTTSASNTLPVATSIIMRDFRVIVQHLGSCTQDSSDIITVKINPATFGNNYQIRPDLGQTSVCGGVGASISVDWTYEIGNWLYRDAGNTAWQILASGNSSITDNTTNVAANTIRSYRVMLANPSQCTIDTSDFSNLTITASIKRNLTSVFPKITGASVICAGVSQTFQLQGYNSQQWFYRDSIGGPWNLFSTVVPNASLASSSSQLNDKNIDIRVVINNAANFCSYDTTGIVSYQVKSINYGNTAFQLPYLTNNTRCTGFPVQVFASKNAQVTGWCWRDQQSGAWKINGSGNTLTDSNTNFTVNTLRSYRALINNGAICRIDTTSEVNIQFVIPQPGSVIPIRPTMNQYNICAGSNITGGIALDTGKMVSKWLYKDNGASNWSEILNQKGNLLSDSNSIVDVKTIRTYVAIIKNQETLRLDTSLGLNVTIQPSLRGNIKIYPTSTRNSVCNNSKLQVTLTMPAAYSTNYWISREVNNQNWTKFGNGLGTITDSLGTSNPKKSYRAILVNGTACRLDTTEEYAVSVLQPSGRSLLDLTPSANAIDVCSGTDLTITTSLPPGSSMANWQYRDNGLAWKTYASNTLTYPDPSSNTKVLIPTIRQYRAIYSNTINCSMDTTNIVSVNIRALYNGVITSQIPRISNSINSAGSTISVTLSSLSGGVQKWIYRDNGGAWNEFGVNPNTTIISDNNTFVTSPIFREYRAITTRTNTCAVDTSLIIGTNIKPYTYGNNNNTQPTASAYSICSGVSYNLSVSGFGGNVAKWIYRVNNAGEWRETEGSLAGATYTETKLNVSVPT